MSEYKFDNPDDAYQEALRLVYKAKDESSRKLNLGGFGLVTLPSEIEHLVGLKELFLADNQLTTLPSEIGSLNRLEELNLNINLLATVPPVVWELKSLEVLKLNENQLTAIPSQISQLTKLWWLYLAHNQLATLSPAICQLTNLNWLDLGNNQLKVLPPEVGSLTWLDTLDLHDNQLTTLPPDIGKLKTLTSLDLHNNQLVTLPPEIGQLAELTHLWLDNNCLTTIPYELTELGNLQELELGGNPNLSIPPEIVAQTNNPETIFDYLRQQQEELSYQLNEAKLILVGQGGVGKTSLVKQLLGKGFDEAENQTEGINIENWSLAVNRPQQGVVHVALNIWDFGGQEIMHATHQFFLTQRSLYLLVLDARQGEDEGRVEYWLALINSFAPDAPVLIIINKSDQHRLDINRRGLQQKYPNIKGFVRTSARDGTGMEQLKTEIATLLATMPHVDSPFPASWMQVKQSLVAMQTDRHYLPYAEYEALCRKSGVAEESSQTTLIRFLHDLGIVLNFNDDDRVRDTSVLNPNWVTKGIYAILNSQALQQKHGLLARNEIRDLLPGAYPRQQQHFLLEMMLKFELAFELSDRQRLLVPDLISKEQPDFDWDDSNALQFAYQYRVLPRNILHRFMVRQHQRIDPVVRWRTGVMLHDDGFTALVKADIKAATIHISIIGEGDRRRFLYSLRLEFAGIHETISGTKPQEVVPIPGHLAVPPINYAFLEDLEQKQVQTIYHAAPNGEAILLDVQALLNGVSTEAMRQAGLPSRRNILSNLRTRFDQGEFYGLLFELGISKNDIGGETVTEQMQELMTYMERRNRMVELVEVIGKKRPFLNP
ncbi:MAG: leucine-rich repeat domain-containing protein [Anaerolineales bacterium]|nr:leucine-rich repeat domain-containing protein [Anaerolineales bacterium]